jgi:hypothetical protein
VRIPDELKEQLLIPAKQTIAYLESRSHMLTFQEQVDLLKLKFAIDMYELEKAHKEGRL